jgi:colicin import membrane protein
LRRREEEARVDAARQAEIDRARHDMEHRARLEQMAQAQAHEAQLAALNQDESKKKLRMAVIGTAAALVVVAVGGFIVYRNNAEEADRKLAEVQAQLQSAQDEAEKRVRETERKLQESASLSEAQKSALQTELEAAKRDALKNQEKAEKSGVVVRGGGGGGKPRPTKPSGPACDPNDPMCGGL